MLLKRDLLEFLLIVCFSVVFLCLLLNYVTNISPLSGVWFTIFILLLCVSSLTLSIRFLKWLIRLDTPLAFNLKDLLQKYPYLSFLTYVFPNVRYKKRPKVKQEYKEYDTNELSVISTVLERKLISSWYVPYISQEIGFPFACKQILDQMIGKAFQICNEIDSKDVLIDVCTVLTCHFKEYKRALKRQEKFPDTPIGTLFRSSHLISDDGRKNLPTAERCIQILRIVLKELVPWELWDTPYSEILVRILSKKLDNFIEETVANPVWLNDKLLELLSDENNQDPKSIKTDERIPNEPLCSIKINPSEELKGMPAAEPMKLEDSVEAPSTIESAVSTIIAETTAPIVQRDLDKHLNDEVIENDVVEVTSECIEMQPIEARASPVLRRRRGRQRNSQVKIYDKVIQGSEQTWRTARDLRCVSLGQDLLAALVDSAPPPPPHPSPARGEEEAVEVDVRHMRMAETAETSTSGGEALLRELHSSVTLARSRIEDLQEGAAGVVEGLLDRGMAGLRRLAGRELQPDKFPSGLREKLGNGHSRVLEHNLMLTDLSEPAVASTSTSLSDEEGGGPGGWQLVKQPRVTSQDGEMSRRSPSPQYEEVHDLPSSVARLRALLHHESEAGWGADTARRAVDVATLADEYDMSGSPPGAGNMQRLDRLFQRTVTGVFNSLRGAGGECAEGGEGGAAPPARWLYVVAQHEHTAAVAAGRLVGARHGSLVEPALDSLHHLQLQQHQQHAAEGAVSGGDVVLELLGALGVVTSHAARRMMGAVLAGLLEDVIERWLEELAARLRDGAFLASEQAARGEIPPDRDEAPPARNLAPSARDEVPASRDDIPLTGAEVPFDRAEYTCDLIVDKLPWYVRLAGQERLREAVRLVLAAMGERDLCRDLALRLAETLAHRAVR